MTEKYSLQQKTVCAVVSNINIKTNLKQEGNKKHENVATMKS